MGRVYWCPQFGDSNPWWLAGGVPRERQELVRLHSHTSRRIQNPEQPLRSVKCGRSGPARIRIAVTATRRPKDTKLPHRPAPRDSRVRGLTFPNRGTESGRNPGTAAGCSGRSTGSVREPGAVVESDGSRWSTISTTFSAACNVAGLGVGSVPAGVPGRARFQSSC